MIIILNIIVFLSEVLDIPHYLLGAPQTPINWREALFLILLIIFVGILAVAGITRGITKRKKVEEVLRKSQQEFVSLFNRAVPRL